MGLCLWSPFEYAGESIPTRISDSVNSSPNRADDHQWTPNNHESQDLFLLGANQPTDEVPHRHTQPQAPPQHLSVDTPILTDGYSGTSSFPSSIVQSSLSPHSPSSSDQHSVRSVIPASPRTGNNLVADCAPVGKVELISVRSNLVCSSCKKPFTSDLRYRQHLRQRCTAKPTCDACGTSFTLLKDLERHRGPAKTFPPPCSLPKVSKRQRQKLFACVCNCSYSRKDVLLRRINLEIARGNTRHQCKT
ncbi:hypothetical protein CC86DRAFT_183867 [Ophiobolus disseminans]|uniref:C2H2-type domain-containing protein n=1 Tax=Ophiobolus disseminans TaxID=1469910 RepID=A0A6A7A6R5_9PLEO|nr:hypothetical protein CC86DRAFT_183867 [Ophiobolus disseminans]